MPIAVRKYSRVQITMNMGANPRRQLLVLTDSVDEGVRLNRVFGKVEPSEYKSLHQSLDKPALYSAVVCDVAIENAVMFGLLRRALLHYRNGKAVPMLWLARDPSELTQAHAKELGASALLPSTASEAALLETLNNVRRLDPTHRADGAGESGPGAQVQTAAAAISNMVEAAKQHKPLSRTALTSGGDAVIAAVSQAKIRTWLDIVWQYDDITYQHSLLVAGLAAAFAARLGLTLKSQRLISQAALVHDIGKANLPHAIINKPGKLTDTEMAVMRTHVTVGHAMLGRQQGFDPQILDIVRHHHEYLDGSGYPDGLRDAEISQFVRLTTICDIYAALIERRSYKPPAPPEKALSILADMGDKLDRGLVAAFHGAISDRRA